MADSDSSTAGASAPATSSRRLFLRFVIPSLLGVLAFLTPMFEDGKITIGLAILSNALAALMDGWLGPIAGVVLAVSALLSIYANATGAGKKHGALFASLFDIGKPFVIVRIVGAIFAAMTLFGVGPEWIVGENTGQVVLFDVIAALVAFFLFASFLLPLLTDFGGMEFVGTLLHRTFRTIFRLPGRSAVDATASWLGDGTVGVIITSKQYEKGYYSARESAVIATNFSIVSITFALLVANFTEIGHLFIPFYLTVTASGLVAAIIVPRLPPLSRKRDDYWPATGKQVPEDTGEGLSLFRWGLQRAMKRAAHSPGFGQLLRDGASTYAEILFGLLPLIMAIGTTGIAIAEYTPIFNWLTFPLVPVLEAMHVPEAAAAAPALLAGFADMFLPAILATSIESEFTRFVIAALSVTQLIYMSEVGAVILKSNVPLNIFELASIFLIRTVITFPIIVAIAHLFVF
ncbi:nucleoside recognition domain-containing protein [Salinisphaera dokdonensis CL-ES53]|uniref:Nucleoside recognition domain-containing protein n=1 Tax=Salinisphaera dokdonensis CL-ES53 TaxID=1304272 RepID=A0ABV2AXQ4_9GAMM